MNRWSHLKGVKSFFATISNLGNGKFWYALMLGLPFAYGTSALPAVLQMGVAGLVTLIVYKTIKSLTGRRRPHVMFEEIVAGTAPLDQYSFPSGHTMHACAFALVALHFYPQLSPVLLPFVILVALSRVILGLHYPTDVAIGAALGSTLGSIVLKVFAIG